MAEEEDRMAGFGRTNKLDQQSVDKGKGNAPTLDEMDFGSASAYRRKEDERSEVNKATHERRGRDRQMRLLYRKAVRAGDYNAAARLSEKGIDARTGTGARRAGDDMVKSGLTVGQKRGGIENANRERGMLNEDQKALQEDFADAGIDTTTEEGKSIAYALFKGNPLATTANERRKLFKEMLKDPNFKMPGVERVRDAFSGKVIPKDEIGSGIVNQDTDRPRPVRDDPPVGRGAPGKADPEVDPEAVTRAEPGVDTSVTNVTASTSSSERGFPFIDPKDQELLRRTNNRNALERNREKSRKRILANNPLNMPRGPSFEGTTADEPDPVTGLTVGGTKRDEPKAPSPDLRPYYDYQRLLPPNPTMDDYKDAMRKTVGNEELDRREVNEQMRGIREEMVGKELGGSEVTAEQFNRAGLRMLRDSLNEPGRHERDMWRQYRTDLAKGPSESGAQDRQDEPFQPFTGDLWNMEKTGRPSRDEGQDYAKQRELKSNQEKAHEYKGGRAYQDIKDKINRSMFEKQINPRYAAQYNADLVDVFKAYESLTRSEGKNKIPSPPDVKALESDPKALNEWISEIKEYDRGRDWGPGGLKKKERDHMAKGVQGGLDKLRKDLKSF